jgi:hypothetical protein
MWTEEEKQAVFYTTERGVVLFMPITVQFRRLRYAGNVAGIGREGNFFTVLASKILRKRRLGRS